MANRQNPWAKEKSKKISLAEHELQSKWIDCSKVDSKNTNISVPTRTCVLGGGGLFIEA